MIYKKKALTVLHALTVPVAVTVQGTLASDNTVASVQMGVSEILPVLLVIQFIIYSCYSREDLTYCY